MLYFGVLSSGKVFFLGKLIAPECCRGAAQVFGGGGVLFGFYFPYFCIIVNVEDPSSATS